MARHSLAVYFRFFTRSKFMGQRANSGRQASLDDKKERAAGRQQNAPSRKAISGRREAPPVPGASGKNGKANPSEETGVFVTGNTSGNKGGRAEREIGKSTRRASKRRA
jgi:hypothetical protein